MVGALSQLHQDVEQTHLVRLARPVHHIDVLHEDLGVSATTCSDTHGSSQTNKNKVCYSHLLQHDKQRCTFTILAFSHTVNFSCILCTKPTIKSGGVLALQNRKEILCYDDQFELPICVRSIVFILFSFLKFIFSLLGRWIVNAIVTHSSLCILLRPTKILVSFLGSSFFSTSALIRRRRKGRSTC